MSKKATALLDGLRDSVVHVYTPLFRLSVAHYPSTLATACSRHGIDVVGDVSDLSAAIGGALLSMDVKGEERCTMTMLNKRENKEIYAEAIPAVGEVRAYVKELGEQVPYEVTTLQRVMYDQAKPVVSVVAGRGSAAVVDLLARTTAKKARLWDGGALTLEPMPSNKNAMHIDKLVAFDGAWGGPAKHVTDQWLPALCEGQVLEAAIASLRRVLVAWHCRCSKDSFVNQLRLIPTADVKDMQLQGQRELVCHYCARAHVMTDNDFASLLSGKSVDAASSHQ
jgi:redox-regulated HSP33 family molecular chaperone